MTNLDEVCECLLAWNGHAWPSWLRDWQCGPPIDFRRFNSPPGPVL